MKIPEEFEQLVRCIEPEGPKLESLQSLAAAALRYKDDDDLRAVLAYLNELLNGRHSDAELHYVWSAQAPRYDFSPGGHRVFLKSCAGRLSRGNASRREAGSRERGGRNKRRPTARIAPQTRHSALCRMRRQASS